MGEGIRITSSNVTSLNPANNVHEFFRSMFGVQKGYVYCPVTEAGNAAKGWSIHFFKWPEEAPRLVDHVIRLKSTRDVYFSPTLFKKPELSRDLVYGTRYLWVEFNGELPDEKKLKRLPTPTFKFRTSVSGHEIWFWKMENFSIDMEMVEDLLKRLANHLGGDFSSWHFESVIRVPGTTHHHSGMNGFLFDVNGNHHQLESFDSLPVAPKYLVPEAYDKLPEFDDVIACKGKWPIDVWRFFKKDMPVDSDEEFPEGKIPRSRLHSAYRKLAFELAEMGLDDKEIFVVLFKADERWGLCRDRKWEARRIYLVNIINYVRKKRPAYSPALEDDWDKMVYSWSGLLNSQHQVEWLINNILPVGSTFAFAADQESGKTRFSISFLMHMAIGRDFLGWKAARPVKSMFVSLEENASSLKLKIQGMSTELLDLTDNEAKLLEDNFILFPLGQSINLQSATGKMKFDAFMERHRPELIIIDSLGVAVQDDLESAVVVNALFNFLASGIRAKFKTTVGFIHHNRKRGQGKSDIQDVFGSTYVKNNLDGIFIIRRKGQKEIMRIEVESAKQRQGIRFKTFECLGIQDSAKWVLFGESARMGEVESKEASVGSSAYFGTIE